MATSIPLRTDEDLQLVKQYIILPVVLDVLERDIVLFGTVPLKMPNIYIELLQSVQNEVTIALAKVRRKLRKRGVRIYEQKRTRLGMEAAYLCRGYHYEFSMMWGIVRAEVEERIRGYISSEVAGKGTGI